MTTVGVFHIGLVVVMTFGDVRLYPLLFGISSFLCRMELPNREESCPVELMVLCTVKKTFRRLRACWNLVGLLKNFSVKRM